MLTQGSGLAIRCHFDRADSVMRMPCLAATIRGRGKPLVVRIMPAIIRQGLVAVADGVAVGAAVGAGVVGADVAAFGAQTALAVALLPSLDGVAGQVGQAHDVNTCRAGAARLGLTANG